MTEAVLGTTTTGYTKFLDSNGNVRFKDPDGRFCSSKAYYGSKGGNRDTDVDTSRNAEEKEDEWGITPPPEERPEVRPERMRLGEAVEKWNEEEGRGWIGKGQEEVES